MIINLLWLTGQQQQKHIYCSEQQGHSSSGRPLHSICAECSIRHAKRSSALAGEIQIVKPAMVQQWY
jgi:hypothetical protein